MNMAGKGKHVRDSESAYEQLKSITDAAQAGTLNNWAMSVIGVLNGYGIVVDRREGIKGEVTLSFPTSTKNKSMGIGIRHLKPDGSWAEDFFLFEESIGITCFYKGAQEQALPEYKGTHHGPPTVELQASIPSIQQDVDSLKTRMLANDIFNSIDMSFVVSPAEHTACLQAIQLEFQQATASAITQAKAFVPAATISMRLKPTYDRKRGVQMEKWSKSERLFNLKLDQLSSVYPVNSEEYDTALNKLKDIFGKV